MLLNIFSGQDSQYSAPSLDNNQSKRKQKTPSTLPPKNTTQHKSSAPKTAHETASSRVPSQDSSSPLTASKSSYDISSRQRSPSESTHPNIPNKTDRVRDRDYSGPTDSHKPSSAPKSSGSVSKRKTSHAFTSLRANALAAKKAAGQDASTTGVSLLPHTHGQAMTTDRMLTAEERLREQRVGTDTSILDKTEFHALGLNDLLSARLLAIKFIKPTKIQAQSIPALKAGRDALIQAQTGSGKTLAYLLPILQDLQSYPVRLTRDDGTQAIVLAPTRELVLQIESVWNEISHPYYWLISTTIMGGAKKKSEKARLRHGCHIVIGTPGRIVDHLDTTASWTLGSVRWLVLDEADRLMDLGFSEAITAINTALVDRCDSRPQCVLCSATLNKKHIRENVLELSSLLLSDPIHIGFDGVQNIDSETESDAQSDHDSDSDAYVAKPSKPKSNEQDITISTRRGASSTTIASIAQSSSGSDLDDTAELKARMLQRITGNKALSNRVTMASSSSSSSSSDSSSDDDSDVEPDRVAQAAAISDGDQSDSSDEDSKSMAPASTNNQYLQVDPVQVNPEHMTREERQQANYARQLIDKKTGETVAPTTTSVEQKSAMRAVDTAYSTPKGLEQLYVSMDARHRLVALASFLRLRTLNAQKQGKTSKIIVFVSTCAMVEFLHKLFQHAYWPDDSVNLTGKNIDQLQDDQTADDGSSSANSSRRNEGGLSSNIAATGQMHSAHNQDSKPALVPSTLWKLHGNMPQHLRTQTFKQFCDTKEGILFSTDVAARGLDLPLLDWIVQFTPPEDTEDYIHRVGRTARIGHSGRAILFLLASEVGYVQVLQRQGAMLKSIPLASLFTGLHLDLPANSPLLTTDRPLGAVLQRQLEKLTSLSEHLNILAKASYMSYIRAYAAYPKSLKGIFHPRRLHLGEVAHSFALTEKPSEITKRSQEIMRRANVTINPLKAQMDEEDRQRKKMAQDSNKSLQNIAKRTEKSSALSEFL